MQLGCDCERKYAQFCSLQIYYTKQPALTTLIEQQIYHTISFMNTQLLPELNLMKPVYIGTTTGCTR
jgi:hypothetical protein